MEWIYGPHFDVDLLVVPRSRAEDCITNLGLLATAQSVESWEALFEEYSQEQVENVLGSALNDIWSSYVYGLEPEPEADELPEDRPPGLYPQIEVMREDWEALAYAADCLDDSDILASILPPEIMALARYPATSPMTGYEPCSWDLEDLPKIRAIAEAHGVTLVNDVELLGRVESAYARR